MKQSIVSTSGPSVNGLLEIRELRVQSRKLKARIFSGVRDTGCRGRAERSEEYMLASGTSAGVGVVAEQVWPTEGGEAAAGAVGEELATTRRAIGGIGVS